MSPFNESHYKNLLSGLDAIEANMREVWRGISRLDSEHFRKRCMIGIAAVEGNRSGFYKLGNKIAYMSGGATPLGAEYPADGVPFLRVQNIMPNHFAMDDIVYLSPKQHGEIARSELRTNDVLFTITGSYGKSAVVPPRLAGANINQHSVKITVRDDVNPFFISCFLNTKYGRAQTDKYVVGISRPALDYRSIRQFSIPDFSDKFQFAIERALKKADTSGEDSKRAMQAASDMLLSELGLDNWRADGGGISVKSFGEVAAANRWDAEYYQPKYDDIMNAIRRVSHNRLGDIAHIQKSIEPGSDSYRESGVPFVRVADLSPYGIAAANKFLGEKEYEKEIAALSPRKNTILFSKDGTLGIAYKVEEDMRAITSGAILHLTAKGGVDPDYLALALNAMPTRMQAERDSGGSIILHWRLDQIRKITVPILSAAAQKRISAEAKKSFRIRRQSQMLLQAAKSAVEIAIEKGEKAGLQMLEKGA